MENEKQITIGSLEDPDNPQRVLSRLREFPTNTVASKIIYIPWDRTKFVCPNHKIRMTINMSDSGIRDKNNKMAEFKCDCGVTYIRTKDQRKLQQ